LPAEKNAFRAGRYIQQNSGYKAFIPAPLPPEPPIIISGKLQKLLSQADRELGRLDGAIEALPNLDLFIYMFVRKEAVVSSQIEGTQSSLQDLLEAEAAIVNSERPMDTDEVIRYIVALNYGLQRLNELPVSARLIREIHGKLLESGRGKQLTPGEFRTRQNWIGPASAGLRDAIFIPPPPHEIPQAISDLEKFIHYDQSFPALIKIGLVHAQFETIHPFLDGNGRMGRLLISFLLCEQKLLQKPALYLSYFFRKERQRYYDLLQNVRLQGDWESWLSFFLEGIIQVSAHAVDSIQRIQILREMARNQITKTLGRNAIHGILLLDYLFDHPFVSVSDVQKKIALSFPAANTLVENFVKIGILREYTGKARNRKFFFEKYFETIEPDYNVKGRNGLP
jgi:Fic family protein